MYMCETKCIIIPKLDSKNFYILIYVFSSFLRNLLPKYILPKFILPRISSKTDNDNTNASVVIYYFDILSNFLSDFLAGIIILKNKCSKENNIHSLTMSSEGEKTIKKMRKLFYLMLPFITLLHFSGQFLFYFFYAFYNKFDIKKSTTEETIFFIIFFDILSRYIFSRVFLDSYFYKHHYVSMFLNTIGFIPLLIISLENIFENDEKKIVITYLILYLIRVIIFALEDIFIKIALNKLLLRPYQLMFYKSLFELLPIIILTIVSFVLYIKEIKNIQDNLLYFIIYRIVFISCYFFSDISLITIIELISPNHLSILKSLEFVFIFLNNTVWNIIEKNRDINIVNYIFEFISFLILLFAACLHNEMIIIKKWGLYECTDYYKTEVKRFSNIYVSLDDEKSYRSNRSSVKKENSEKKNEEQDDDTFSINNEKN